MHAVGVQIVATVEGNQRTLKGRKGGINLIQCQGLVVKGRCKQVPVIGIVLQFGQQCLRVTAHLIGRIQRPL